MKPEVKINLLGIYLLLILFVLIIIAVVAYFFYSTDQLIRALIFVGCSGGIGGTIYSIRGFYQNLGERNFQLNWSWWYIFRPIISIVIGVFVYFLIAGGLISFGLISETDYSKGILFFCGISFLSGFSFTRVADKFENLSSILFSKKEKKK